MKFARLVVGVSLTLALAGCADHPELTGPAEPANAGVTAAEGPSLRQGSDAPMSAPFTAFGAQRVWSNGLSITISQPRSLKPSETAFPQAPRAAVFVVTILNGSKSDYRPGQLTVRALAGGKAAQEVLDSVQGLNGVASAVNELPPGRDTTLTLAFAVPAEDVRMQLTVEPNGAGQEPSATFAGEA